MAYKLPGNGETLYQQLVAHLLAATAESDGARRASYTKLSAMRGDPHTYELIVTTALAALAVHPQHQLHGWTIVYDRQELQFIARPPEEKRTS